MSGTLDKIPFGFGDNSYQSAGGRKGLKRLCEDFYQEMDSRPGAAHIRKMHKEQLPVMVEKLTSFLSMWLGGPKDYMTKEGGKPMPLVHEHLIIGENERDAWLLCMDEAVNKQKNFSKNFKDYLKKQFRFPAEVIRKTSRN